MLEATVVDGSGKPVSDAEVIARNVLENVTTKTDANGVCRFSVGRMRTGFLLANLFARGANGDLGEFAITPLDGDVKPIKIVLKPAHRVEVAVVDDGGKPVAHAEVHLLSGFCEFTRGQTDASGRWTVEVPADSKDWKFYALKSKVGFDYAQAERRRNSLDPLLPLPTRITLTLDGARPPLRIKTLDQHGRPIAGVKLGPSSVAKAGRESELRGISDAFPTSDANGVAVIDWLPVDKDAKNPSRYQIASNEPEVYIPGHFVSVPTLSGKPADEMTVTFLPYVELSGRVTTIDGKPAVDAEVTASGRGSEMNGFRGMTRTDADGRYKFKAQANEAYIIAAVKETLAALHQSTVILRTGKPVTDANLVLTPGTVVRGTVTIGKDKKPATDVSASADIDKGSIPDDLKSPNSRGSRTLNLRLAKRVSKDGQYSFVLAPGDYQLSIQSPTRTAPIKLTIPAANPPRELVHDFALPRAMVGPFQATVVDISGKPIPNAIVEGRYKAPSASFLPIKSGEQGTIRTRRYLEQLVLGAFTADRSSGAVALIDADATEARIVAKPTASATGRLVDPDGKPIAEQEIGFGIRVRYSESRNGPSGLHFGQRLTTNKDGTFRLNGLVVGQIYQIDAYDSSHSRDIKVRPLFRPTEATTLSLGDVIVDLSPPKPEKPYVPPTPATRANDAFEARQEKSPREKIDYALIESKRDYTRPLVLLGNSKDPVFVELFRLFEEESERGKATPGNYRYDFELVTLDKTLPDVKTRAAALNLPLVESLTVLNDDGKPVGSFALKLDAKGNLDASALTAFMLKHKLPTRDAEKMVAEGLAKAKAENKRVFLIMSASWCGPCRLLGRFLAAHNAELEKHFVFVKLDVARDAHSDQVLKRVKKEDVSGGIPWYVIVDADGKPLITSNATMLEEAGEGMTNIGFPGSPDGIDHLLNMIKTTAPAIRPEALTQMRKELQKKR